MWCVDKEPEDEDLHFLEPLLKNNSNQHNDDDGQESSVSGKSVTPYANANLFSILTFSWIGPLLALGYRKTQDLEDVPHLGNCDSANVVFARFRSNLEPSDNNGNSDQVSTLKLVKALILSTRKEILWMGIFYILCTLASNVGPYLIDAFVQIATFLCLNDLHPNIVQKLPRDGAKVVVEIENGNFSWDLHSSNLTLKDLNFQVYHGMKVAVCGSVGSGKSSLLSCILGEVPKVSGAFRLNGTKAYVAQSPWIQSGKIIDNILFGKEMDKESVVDAHTGNHLFKECLLKILGSKTVIYVTYQVEFLPSVVLILVMRDGRITQAGKYEEILSSGTNFMELVGIHTKALANLNLVKHGASLPNSVNGEKEENMLSLLIVTVGYKTATLLFNKMHLCIFRAPMSFFDSTPIGRILNQASLDQSAVDTSIPHQTEELLISIIEFLGTAAVMSQVAWKMLIVFIPMTLTCIWYQVWYAPHLPLVLRGLTCTFSGGMKIGIVGRTRSGKSTFVHALFRMLEPTVGQIWVDALDKCHLGDEIRKKEGKFDSTVTENGENWSMGQRQLVYLGRVLLKRSKVLVLDEATASMDTMTNYLIQKTLSQHFSGSTVITIAHRITSILDVDMVFLLDNGLILEYDSPTKLLEIKSSSFAKLVKEYTGRCSY
ncbi:ABC transporter C family member 7-like [Telopea speciosissima]|uniref:ABC transporter C family member 7-like n=1 Tax=Telopea speciosissima TaxID=54955 RepID=UPI001CC538B4|nr:ABC transporter C family member 7-like [Telopea speciosissima]